MLQWLQECLETHEVCQTRDGSFSPKRVLDILPRKSFRDPVLIDEFANICNDSTRYMCLSHCWGKTPVLRTIKSTLEQHKKGIPWTWLSKTFQDAINIALHFDVRYLWIDSLCIIQDDETDWQLQAGEMASIYENSFVTIAATAAGDGNSGCFRKTSPEFIDVVTVSRTSTEGKTFTACCRREIQHSDPLIQGPLGCDKVQAPLVDRAWVFQEHYLSPRVLQFTDMELMWECNSCLRCECSRVLSERYERKYQVRNASKTVDMHILFDAWRQKVNAYSYRRLSYESDKLPALSGLAQQTQRQISSISPGRYFAGLWEDDFIEGLTWTSGTNPGGQSFTIPYRAPSWSWVSLDGIVSHDARFQIDMNGPVASILEIRCVPTGLDLTGAVCGGHVKMASRVIEVTLDYDAQENADPREIRYYITFNSADEMRPQIYNDYPFAEAGEGYIASGETIHCFFLGLVALKARNEPTADGDDFKALLLRPSTKISGCFRRVGLLQCSGLACFDAAPTMSITIV